MRRTNKNIKIFYEDFYDSNREKNPAFEIYDELRIKGIKTFINQNTDQILIIGCGNQNDIELMDTLNSPIAFDLSYNAVKSIKKDQNVINADALSIPFSDNSFDLVICSEVIEHIPEANLAISEIARILNKDGILIISTPNWFSLFGFSRWLMEAITKSFISSDNQPYDDWKTRNKLKKDLFPYFKIDKAKGVWYFPPMHFRRKGLSKQLTMFIFKIFSPFEILFSNLIPYFGHIMIVKCSKPFS